MSKHTKSFKLKLVKNYESSLLSYLTLSNQYKISTSSLVGIAAFESPMNGPFSFHKF